MKLSSELVFWSVRDMLTSKMDNLHYYVLKQGHDSTLKNMKGKKVKYHNLHGKSGNTLR